MEGHGCSWLEVSKFEAAGAHVGVVVKEPEEGVLELWELFLTGEACVVLHVIVHKVDALWFEKGSYFFVLVNNIPKVDLAVVRVNSLISASSPEEHPGEDGKSFEAPGKVPELEEEDWYGWQYVYLEGVLESAASVIDVPECWEDSKKDVLPVGVEEWDCGLWIFWFGDMCGLEIVLEVGVVCWLPLRLPTNVVGVAIGPAGFVILDSLNQVLGSFTSWYH